MLFSDEARANLTVDSFLNSLMRMLSTSPAVRLLCAAKIKQCLDTATKGSGHKHADEVCKPIFEVVLAAMEADLAYDLEKVAKGAPPEETPPTMVH